MRQKKKLLFPVRAYSSVAERVTADHQVSSSTLDAPFFSCNNVSCGFHSLFGFTELV